MSQNEPSESEKPYDARVLIIKDTGVYHVDIYAPERIKTQVERMLGEKIQDKVSLVSDRQGACMVGSAFHVLGFLVKQVEVRTCTACGAQYMVPLNYEDFNRCAECQEMIDDKLAEEY